MHPILGWQAQVICIRLSVIVITVLLGTYWLLWIHSPGLTLIHRLLMVEYAWVWSWGFFTLSSDSNIIRLHESNYIKRWSTTHGRMASRLTRGYVGIYIICILSAVRQYLRSLQPDRRQIWHRRYMWEWNNDRASKCRRSDAGWIEYADSSTQEMFGAYLLSIFTRQCLHPYYQATMRALSRYMN